MTEDLSMTQTTTTDIRIEAWAFGRNSGTAAVAYRLLENGDARAVRVFAALSRNEWGVEAAFRDGLKGVDITATDPKTGVTYAWTAGGVQHDAVPALIKRRGVAANGGTI